MVSLTLIQALPMWTPPLSRNGERAVWFGGILATNSLLYNRGTKQLSCRASDPDRAEVEPNDVLKPCAGLEISAAEPYTVNVK